MSLCVGSSDSLFGGFTVVQNKVKYKKIHLKESLPYWIDNPVTCTTDLHAGSKVKDVDTIYRSMRKRLKKMKIKCLFPIQALVIPYLMEFYLGKYKYSFGQPRDLCIAAPTGSGKTLAYIVPLIQLLELQSEKSIKALIILPVRDLAKQVINVFHQAAIKTSVKVVLLVGEKSFANEQKDLYTRLASDKGVDVVICTPGRLVDHIYNTRGFCLRHLQFLIIDEADRVISEEKQDWYNVLEGAVYGVLGHYPDMILENNCPLRHFAMPTIEDQCVSATIPLHKILVSATLTHDPEPLKRFRLNFPRLFIASIMKSDPEYGTKHQILLYEQPMELGDPSNKSIIEHTDVKEFSRNISGVGTFITPVELKEFIVRIQNHLRPLFLVYLIRQLKHSRILCFANSRETVKRLSQLLDKFGSIKVKALTAAIPLAKRTRILQEFSQGDLQLIICTDAVARGIDIEDITCVVSYEPPKTAKIYIHRIGRTARAGKTGQTYTILLENQVVAFKKELRLAGKRKFKELIIHASKVRCYQKEYRTALKELGDIYQYG